MAMENPLVVADVIGANEFPELSERYAVMSVPKTVVNDRTQLIGAQPEAKLLAAITEALSRDA
ncbi:MAG: thioredoxin family protein [Chloroflexota bacterium]|nr:thioredoxin family protein [Chloroflexota bacterium]